MVGRTAFDERTIASLNPATRSRVCERTCDWHASIELKALQVPCVYVYEWRVFLLTWIDVATWNFRCLGVGILGGFFFRSLMMGAMSCFLRYVLPLDSAL